MFVKNIRKATPGEINHFEHFLYPFQDEIFELMKTEYFYLSGGTCLSRFFYQHRYSEDLDFFFDGYRYSKDEFQISFRQIVNRISEEFRTEITIDDNYFKRIFVYKENFPLKIEFIFENFKNAGKRQKVKGISIDSPENIAVNKITAIYDRKATKDFIDLYFLLQDMNLNDIIKWTEYKIVPLDYEGVLIALSNLELEGTVLLKENLNINQFEEFVLSLTKKLVDHAKES